VSSRVNLKNLLTRGPGQLLQLDPDPDAQGLAETLVAFANADGGTILIGLQGPGAIPEDLDPEHVEATLLRAVSMCQPPVQTDWQAVETPQGAAVAISVTRSPLLHSLEDGRVLLRSGSRNRPLSGGEIRQLASAKGSGDFEQETVAGARVEDLDEALVADHLESRRLRGPRGEKLDADSWLTSSGAVDAQGRVTVAGMLLFGKEPQRFLPHSGAVLVRFPGTHPSGGDAPAGYMRREDVSGSLGQVIEGLWQAIWQEVRHESVLKGLKREDVTEYPPFAVREAIVNAVAHRDYRLSGRRIEVRMFDDRMEIGSPGGLPGHITLDNIVEEHFSRNPRIVRGLFHWGFIEELGLGIDRMIEEMLRAGHPAPQFDAHPFGFRVVLRNARERPAAKWVEGLNERQIKALSYLQEHRRITNREYQVMCPDVTTETLRLDLVAMVENGILLRIGHKKGTYYMLK